MFSPILVQPDGAWVDRLGLWDSTPVPAMWSAHCWATEVSVGSAARGAALDGRSEIVDQGDHVARRVRLGGA